jgi:hypothetical protein
VPGLTDLLDDYDDGRETRDAVERWIEERILPAPTDTPELEKGRRSDIYRKAFQLEADVASLRAEVERLQAEALTDDDKEFIVSGLLLHAPRWRIPEEVTKKLQLSRRISDYTSGGEK